MKADLDWEDRISLNDDLESFFSSLQTSEKVLEDEEEIDTFFTPQLTEKELVLVHDKNEEYLESFFVKRNADVSVDEMAKSSSKSKYIHALLCSNKNTYNLEGNYYDKTKLLNAFHTNFSKIWQHCIDLFMSYGQLTVSVCLRTARSPTQF